MNSPPPTRRRRLQFSLRTLFVVVTLLCVWLGYHINWIRQRHDYAASHKRSHKDWSGFLHGFDHTSPKRPYLTWYLRLFGEEMSEALLLDSEADIDHVRSLFPEASLMVRVSPPFHPDPPSTH